MGKIKAAQDNGKCLTFIQYMYNNIKSRVVANDDSYAYNESGREKMFLPSCPQSP